MAILFADVMWFWHQKSYFFETAAVSFLRVGYFLRLVLSSADFSFKINSSNINLLLLECQTVWIKIRKHALYALMWVQTVLQGYLQTTKFAVSKEILKKE